jgi:predicted DsbA family dithiol-disulfide isomerase
MEEWAQALALLEEAVLLLEEGRAAEVKALAAELVRVFEANGVHREALMALQLFHAAAEQEKATAELARRVLRFLFRAQHDRGVRFEE